MTDHERAGSARLEYFPRCATCRWAETVTSLIYDPRFPLRCSKMAEDERRDGKHGGPLHFDTLALAPDTEGYYGSWLSVSPRFGCVQHEEKPSPALTPRKGTVEYIGGITVAECPSCWDSRQGEISTVGMEGEQIPGGLRFTGVPCSKCDKTFTIEATEAKP